MATAALPQNILDLASSLSQDEIPVKLRCASCNRLVLNAFRLPCCDQNICEACQSSLPESCPVCAHSPISAADCKPNKSLRLTVKAFLKSEEKKREKERAISTTSIPATPITPAAPDAVGLSVIDEQSYEMKGSQEDESVTVGAIEASKDGAQKVAELTDQVDIVEQPGNDQSLETSKEALVAAADGEETNGNNLEPNHTSEALGSGSGWSIQNSQNGDQMPGQFGFGSTSNGFQGNDWSGGLNPMMMQQMQTAMASGNWAFPNMMGMPGMGMNPMDMSQAMFGGFGMQGMNGMNGMMGMDFSSGFGWNNGQQMSSDFGNSGNFYAGGGYNQSHQSHFQHQNQFARNNAQNQSHFHGQGPNQGSGMGQSQGPSSQASNDPKKQITDASDPSGDVSNDGPNMKQDDLKDVSEAIDQSKQDVDEVLADSKNPGNISNAQDDQNDHGADDPSGEGEDATNNKTSEDAVSGQGQTSIKFSQEQESFSGAQNGQYSMMQSDGANGQFISSFDASQNGYMQNPMMHGGFNQGQTSNFNNYPHDQTYQMGIGGYEYSYRGRGRGGYGRGGWRNRGGFQQQQFGESQVVTPAQPTGQGVEGAPTGPRAMRGGFAGRGGFRGRGGFGGRGGFHGSEASEQAVTQHDQSNASTTKEPSEATGDREEADRKSERRSRSRSRSRSNTPRSRSHSRSRHRHNRRHRSRSISSDQGSHEKERKHRQHRSSRKKYDDDNDHIEEDNWRDTRDKHRSRESSVESSRSKHRSHRRDKDRHRSSRSHRESSRERRKQRHRSRTPDYMEMDLEETSKGKPDESHPTSESGKRKSRSERHRERDRDSGHDRARDKDRDYDRDKYRERDRDRDKDRERRRSKRDRSEDLSEDDRHRSSRHSRRDRDRDRDREYDRQVEEGHHSSRDKERRRTSRVEAAPEEEFRIHGRSKEGSDPTFNPPKGPAATRQPPTGPRALLTKISTMNPPSAPASSRRSHPPTPISAEVTPSATTPTDAHTMEREARNRERMLKEQQRRQQLHGGNSSSGQLERKRSFNDHDEEQEKPFMPPTGPKGDHGRRKKSRRMNYKYEDEENDEARARRVENEREASRWH